LDFKRELEECGTSTKSDNLSSSYRGSCLTETQANVEIPPRLLLKKDPGESLDPTEALV